jgi:hypothetical protein
VARLPEEEIKRRYQENLELYRDSISDEEALELWPDLSPGERTRRRKLKETQKARYETVVDDETGQRMMGGPQHQGQGGIKKAVMEAVADLANGDRQKEVIDGLFSGLDRKEAPAVRGKAAERIIKITHEQIEVERRDRQELLKLGEEELVDKLVGLLLGSGTDDKLIAALIKANQKALPVLTVDADDARAA